MYPSEGPGVNIMVGGLVQRACRHARAFQARCTCNAKPSLSQIAHSEAIRVTLNFYSVLIGFRGPLSANNLAIPALSTL